MNQISRQEEKKEQEKTQETKSVHAQPPNKSQITFTPQFNVEDNCLNLEVAVNKGGWVIKSIIASNESFF
jgi:hypothetical protein